ncbi:MAG: hypothetical protein SFU56_21590 [Capsulimonadales bacterium]|nr:hypothetical protein [Capsulimonadales bacterium]
MNSNNLQCAQVAPIRRVLAASHAGLSVMVLGLASAVPAKAQEAPIPPDTPKVQQERENDSNAAQGALSKKWVVEVTPYVWATGISGSLRPFAGGRTIEFDESFSDVLEDLDSAFFLAASARRGRLMFVGDFSFVDLSQEGVVPPNVKARGSLRQISLTLAAGYQAVAHRKMTVDVLLGFRSWVLKPGVEAEAGGIDVSREKRFTDIVIGTRRNFHISDDWSFLLYGDVGIFRAGSHATNQIVGTVSYRARRDFFLSLGYRQLKVDYRQDGTRVDARLSGPLIGATWRFK